MPQDPTIWTDAEKPETRWVSNCNQCPFNIPGDYDDLGWPERERTCGHPDGGHSGYELKNGTGRCPLPWSPIMVRYGWSGHRGGRRPGV